MKVLLSAYCCSPASGSEQAVGWHWARCIANLGHQVVVLTRAINRNDIHAACPNDSNSNPRFVFHDLPPLVQRLYKLPLGNYVYYLLWQYTAARKAVRLHQLERFDRVHHLTWVSFRFPSFMGRLGIPFTLGPVAGGEDTPKHLRRGLGWRGRLWDSMRRLTNVLFSLTPQFRSTFAAATEICATTPETLRTIPPRYRHKGRVQQAVGISPEDANLPPLPKQLSLALHRPRPALNLLFVGRLLPWKGLHLALHALAKLPSHSSDIHLTLVGSGYDCPRLVRLAARLGVTHSISWISWTPRDKLLRMYSEHDLFLFPSLHDSGGLAVLEAMTFGLPVLCLDLGGPALSVDDTCGHVIATSGRSEDDLAQAIASFLLRARQNPHLLPQLSEGARLRASSLTWQARVRAVYPHVLPSQSSPKNLQYESVL